MKSSADLIQEFQETTFTPESLQADFKHIVALNAEGAVIVPMSWRSERVLVRAGELVIKVHAVHTDVMDLRRRLRIISSAPWNKVFLKPKRDDVLIGAGGRALTLWPLARALDADAEEFPWVSAARLLAQLHSIPIDASSQTLPRVKCRALDRVHEVLKRFDAVAFTARDSAWQLIHQAAQSLELPEMEPDPQHWVHGDWHLGQIVEIVEGEQKVWKLIDMEDMGIGHGIWDLARPAAYFAAGILTPADWGLFLKAYYDAGGRALPREGDPWLVLERPARALLVQSAASAFLKALLDERPLHEDERLLVEACRRIVDCQKSALGKTKTGDFAEIECIRGK